MDATAIIAALSPALPGVALEAAPSVDINATVYAPTEHLRAVLTALRDTPGVACDFLMDVVGVDYFPREPRFEVVYQLVSTTTGARVRLKIRVADGQALPTVQDIYPAAGWAEREVWDMFGIDFADHPDLRRILMPEDWDGHPQRKDYPVQVKLAAKTYEPLEISEEEYKANLERDRVHRTLPRQ